MKRSIKSCLIDEEKSGGWPPSPPLSPPFQALHNHFVFQTWFSELCHDGCTCVGDSDNVAFKCHHRITHCSFHHRSIMYVIANPVSHCMLRLHECVKRQLELLHHDSAWCSHVIQQFNDYCDTHTHTHTRVHTRATSELERRWMAVKACCIIMINIPNSWML